ncbi:hypothetical protein NL676_038268 [Syzygium grande]|nr:hypothetical protein NL676_038268 [Syzygium grande]
MASPRAFAAAGKATMAMSWAFDVASKLVSSKAALPNLVRAFAVSPSADEVAITLPQSLVVAGKAFRAGKGRL